MQDSANLALADSPLNGSWLALPGDDGFRPPIIQHIASKRIFDLSLAAGALIALIVVFLLVAALVRLSSRGPVFFKHERIGRGGRTFGCLKFRTMHVDGNAILARHLADDPEARAEWETTQKLRHDPRVTLLGRYLRRSSLDELPQLVNIIRGEMSIVGPRPIQRGEIQRYGRHIEAYYRVRPGLTGLWQVSGRSETDYDRRVAYDCEYVSRRCFRFDLEIVLRTIPVVFLAKGAC